MVENDPIKMDAEGAFRKKIIDSVGNNYLRNLSQLNETDSLFRFIKVMLYYLVFFILYLILSRIGYNYIPYFLLPMWGILVINFNRINVITHDAAHYQILNNKKSNDAVTNFLAAYTCLHDVNQYRKSHHVHHHSLHTDEDPDTEFYELNFQKIIQDLLLITFIKQTFYNKSKMKKSVFVYLYQVIIFCAFLIINGNIVESALHYLMLFIYPLIGIFVLIIRIRTYIQHHSDVNEVVTRTTVPAFIEKLFIGQKMEYHLEHHLFPGIPYYNLITLHQKLSDTLYQAADFKDFITKTYFTHVH